MPGLSRLHFIIVQRERGWRRERGVEKERMYKLILPIGIAIILPVDCGNGSCTRKKGGGVIRVNSSGTSYMYTCTCTVRVRGERERGRDRGRERGREREGETEGGRE